MYIKKRIYILVKTYPVVSDKYSELVCTAGILEDGSWIRLYPVPFRFLEDEKRFPKFSWIEVEVQKRSEDFRPESYSPNLDTLRVEEKMPVNWRERKRSILKSPVYSDLSQLIRQAKSSKKTSLAIFKPARMLDFKIRPGDREWDEKIRNRHEQAAKQVHLTMSAEEMKLLHRLPAKVPYDFYYQFEDENGIVSQMKIMDWEINALYWNCLRNAANDEAIALEKVRRKYWTEFMDRDLHLFLGTTLAHHHTAPNPFTIVGVFYPPVEKQISLFD
ncbi:MAG TPA: hypothetical protein GX720_02870 [Clostridiaceae bacterium]|jgi:hypothetical protein|nr:hypothetical protein [Clostridiaceae bacterium]